jgi:hypothetical protein
VATKKKTAKKKTANPPPESTPLEENVKAKSTWLRLFFMVVIFFLYAVSRVVIGAVVVLQFFWVLFTGSENSRLKGFGQALATYTYQTIRYLTFVTEERPFPFDADWPTGPPET